ERVIELLEVMREERAGEITPVRPPDDGLDPPLDAAHARRPAAARARRGRGHRLGKIADAVADEGHAGVVEIGDHHLSDLPGLHRAPVAEDLDDVPLGHDVVALVRLALVGDARELAAAVLVEDLAAERLLDEPAAWQRQRLRARHDRARPRRDLAGALD